MVEGRRGTKGVPRADREQQIIEAASAVFDRHGFIGTSMSAIAVEADISKPLVHGYFGSKEALHERCVDAAGERLVAAVAGAARDDSTARALATLRAIFGTLEQHPHDWGLIYDVSAPNGCSGAARSAEFRRTLNAFGVAGVSATISSDDALDESLLTQVWFATLAAVVRWWRRHPDQTAEQMSQRSARLLGALAE